MNIDTPLRELGPIDIADLREVILAQEDIAWNEDQYRQDEYEVHAAPGESFKCCLDQHFLKFRRCLR